MKILALVTAKSTSTRIAYKNKMPLHGRPLYTWTIDYVTNHRGYFEDMAFSSDRPWDYRLYTGWMMIKRPQYYLLDSTPHIESVKQGLLMAEKITGKKYDGVALFQPTNPHRSTGLVQHAYALARHHRFTDIRYMSRCVYVDRNLSKQYMIGATWDKDEGGPTIKSGALYFYSKKFLIEEGEFKEMRMVVPKSIGYNLNDEDDIPIIETFMHRDGVPYGYNRLQFEGVSSTTL